jgi:hypothetical protein
MVKGFTPAELLNDDGFLIRWLIGKKVVYSAKHQRERCTDVLNYN